MTLNAFERIFTNNSHYREYEGIIFFDSLAYMVQEFLYTDKTEFKYTNYRMDDRIKLYDFMTLTSFFVRASTKDLGKATIIGYIRDLRKTQYSYQKDVVEYKNEGLLVLGASHEFIEDLLWTSYIYAKTRYEVEKDEDWKNTMDMLYDLMIENSAYDKDYFKTESPLSFSEEATQVMIKHIRKRYNQEKEEPRKDDNPELEALRKENKDLIAETQRINKKLEEYQKEEEESAEAIDWHDKVRLDMLLRLMEKDGANLEKYGNKMKAAKVMQSITGLPLQTCKNYCTNRDLNKTTHEEEILKMNTLLQALEMEIRL